MQVAAPAKINLGLRILRKRDDGYHDIETVFTRIGWHDQLSIEPSVGFSFECSDARLPLDKSNLVVRAVQLFEDYFDVEISGRLRLDKDLPFGAGLGGGSSDAASTLLLCATLVSQTGQLSVTQDELHILGERLGADVPFFLTNGIQVGTGIGTQLAPLFADQNGELPLDRSVVVVAPNIPVSSADAYRRVVPREHKSGELSVAEIVRTNNLAEWRASLVNDFEGSVFSAHPEIRRTKKLMQDAGAGYASLSGSGSAVFGVFESMSDAHQAGESMQSSLPPGYRTWVGKI